MSQDKPTPASDPGVIWEPPQPAGSGSGGGGDKGGGGGGGGDSGSGDTSLCGNAHIDALFRTKDGSSYVFKGGHLWRYFDKQKVIRNNNNVKIQRL